ncbi:UDP-N-acetylmuramoyl-L-alanyl-D-glutamate--2,6-diaminopimelate ligase [Priestia filamentosa]|uniref:UDP-N-acetylmuramoyl-L-alanyl-D-glutamate--2, 6-diaminopimelate ligase n=1 Tax=Priestia filamentosa TaxID=1402861 RepID=UPI003979BCBB
MDTGKLLSALKIKKVIGNLPNQITTLVSDSRRVQRGSVFVCIKGNTVDGHEFINKAVHKGAELVVVEYIPKNAKKNVCYLVVPDTTIALAHLANKYYDYPSSKLNIIGVTGTNGKTTVTSAINQIFRNEGLKTGLTGTIFNDINGEIFPTLNTTSDSITIQETLHKMVEAGVTNVVMEVSSHGLSLGRLLGVDFQMGVFTNLTQDHLDFHGTMENYKHAKSLLFSQLGQDIQRGKVAILNADDPATDYYKTVTGASVITYGIDNEADYKAKDIIYYGDKTEFTLVHPSGEERLEIPFVGKFNVSNMLAAIISVFESGIEIQSIAKSIQTVQPANGRMERILEDEKRYIFIDYAHTPDGVEKVLDSVKLFANPQKKIFFVIGTGGNRDKLKRPIMGKLASDKADFVVFTTDNPRFEPWEEILEQMAAGAIKDNYECIGDREQAICRAIELALEGDIVVIAGKGHEEYQIIGDRKYPFNDKEIALKAIKKFPL